MRLSTAEKVNAGFVVALAIVVIIGLASITSLRRFLDASDEVSRTHNVLTQLQTVLANLTAAESAQRAYVITQDASYLETFHGSLSTVLAQVHLLREETVTYSEQQQRIAQFGELVARRRLIMYETITALETSGLAAATAGVSAGHGREVMDSVRAVAADFERAELNRLALTSSSARARARLAIAIVGGGGLFAFFIVLGSALVIRRDYTERRRAETALRESETLLSQFMETLPIGVMVVDAQWSPRFANDAAVGILGTSVLLDTGQPPLPLYRAGDHEPYP